MIGLALVTTVFIVGQLDEADLRRLHRGLGRGRLRPVHRGVHRVQPRPHRRTLADLPEIDAITGVRFNRFLFEGHERDLVAAEADAPPELVDIDLQTGRPRTTSTTTRSSSTKTRPATSVSRSATRSPWSSPPADRRSSPWPASTPTPPTSGNYLIDLDLFSELLPDQRPRPAGLRPKLADGVDPADARAAIDGVLADHPQVKLDDRAALQADQQAQFDSILIAVNGLLGLALLIALLGIANTLALSVLERTREIGLLRAVGMLRRQAREMVLAESAMVAIFGAVLGIVVGMAFGVAIAMAMPPSVITTTAIPFGTLAVIVAVAALCGVIAGLLPARRAARLDVLRAIASE